MFRMVLSDKAFTQSATTEANKIVDRAEIAVERYKAEIAERTTKPLSLPTPIQQPKSGR